MTHMHKQRPLKYRAWDFDSSEMITELSTMRDGDFYLGFQEGEMCLLMHLEEDYPEQRDAHIMEFTGLHDKNRKEIYEADRAKFYYKGEMVTCEIVWNPKGLWSLKWDDGYINNYFLIPENLEVVGNIYQSSNLLISSK